MSTSFPVTLQGTEYEVSVGIAFLVLLGVASTIDLSGKWFAYGRFDSFGISIGSFATVYAVVEARSGGSTQLQRLAWAGIPTLAMVAYHTYCKAIVDDQLAEKLREVRNELDGKDKGYIQLFDVISDVTRKSFLVAFSGSSRESQVRSGKRQQRQNSVALLNATFPSSSVKFEEKDFLPPDQFRYFGLGLFTIGGAVAALSQVIEVTEVLPQIP